MNLSLAQWEGIKEVLRWVVLMSISWVITAILAQIDAVPEHHNLQVWVFHFMIPVRFGIQMALTFIMRYIDKVKFVKTKNSTEETKGLLWF